jgi:hypothetical protein
MNTTTDPAETPRLARPDERERIGREIDTDKAEVWFYYAQILDPYGELALLEEERCVGRVFFAVDPEVGISVAFYDLPKEKREALSAKEREANRQGWAEILGSSLASSDDDQRAL